MSEITRSKRDDTIGKNWFVNLDPALKEAWLEGRTLDPKAESSQEDSAARDSFWWLRRRWS
jgi:hypothetical protein